jgi:hypothetical protein
LFFFFLDPETKNQDCIKKAKNYQVSLKWNKSQLLNTIKPGMTYKLKTQPGIGNIYFIS